MSDKKLRDLEYRWRKTGDNKDEFAYLRERLRCGYLSEDRLKIAALCDHQPAIRLIHVEAPEDEPNVVHWVERFDRTAPYIIERAALLAIKLMIEKQPDIKSALFLKAYALALNDIISEKSYLGDDGEEAHRELISEELTAHFDEGERCHDAYYAMASMVTHEHTGARFAIDRVAQFLSDSGLSHDADGELKETIKSGLISWALGYDDPLI
jgi:hypothetical protein